MTYRGHHGRLPIGIQTFREIRQGSLYYVDKTGFALQLVQGGKHYFLSRPRRFGKSLFLDTLKELFEGNREIFKGLHAYGRWDWSVRHPVVKLSFGKGDFTQPGYLHKNVMARLGVVEREAAVEGRHDTAPERFDHLLRVLHARTGHRAVVLIDEYDKPILDALPEERVARANRNYLRGLYSTIKDCDAHVRFSFLTGVSNFSKVSLCSGLNNLIDITLEPAFSSICGYAEEDPETVFATELPGLDRDRMRDWYSGYSWGGEERVYNPFDALLLFRSRKFRNWWFETGSPTFLLDVLARRGADWHRLDGMLASDELLSKFDVGEIGAEALLFQSGYLTVLGSEEADGEECYRLGYPNREVRQSLNRALLDSVLGSGAERRSERSRLRRALRDGDLAGLREQLRALLAGIPHQWHGRNPMGGYEGWYASVLYSHFAAVAGVEVRAEESGSGGRADLSVRGFGRVYVFEFKMRERTGAEGALEQLRSRGYADRYRGRGEPIHLVGVEFSAQKRNMTLFESDTI